MSIKQILLGVSILQPLVGCATPPAVKTTLRVVEEEVSEPISNATVSTVFLLEDYWGKPDKYQKVEKVSDNQGQCVLEGKDLDHYFNAKIDSDGYYQSLIKVEAKKNNRFLNRWEPWNPTFEVEMRPKKNPVPMVQKYIEWKPVPNIGSTVGYDLEVGDWVAPHGKGEVSDLILATSSYMQEGKKGSEARYVLSFSNEHDGIQSYCFPKGIRSSFKWPYEAPLDGYQPTLEKFKHWDVNGTPDKSNYAGKNNYIFRVRSRKLEDGSIVACYGTITGELEFIPQGKIRFSYYFNPVENERSLEYSGENLFKK